MGKSIVFLFALVLSFNATAVMYEFQLEQLVGWTLLASKQIRGQKAPEKPLSNTFEGCDFGTIIYFTDSTSLECNSFGFQFTFMPKAFIFGKEVEYEGKKIVIMKMMVGGELYDVY